MICQPDCIHDQTWDILREATWHLPSLGSLSVMTVATDVTIPLVPVDTLEFSADPQTYLEAARRVHPWLGRFSQGYVVYGYDAVSDLLFDSENLKPGLGPVV